MDDPNSTNASKSGGLSWTQKVVAAIGTITLIVGAVTTLMLALPQLFKATRDAKDAAFDLMKPTPVVRGMAVPVDHEPPAQLTASPGQAGGIVGAKPGSNCHEVLFTDNSAIPPKTSITWKC